jgi:flagellar basal-body rod modification protein FlgD
MSTTISATSSLSSADSQTASRIPMQTLGQEDFLKLLVTQMTSQDPMNPQKDTDFIAQMAQFSSLEQAKGLSEKMSSMEASQQFTQAAALLGKTVKLQTAEGALVTGVVSSLQVLDGVPKLVVGNKPYALEQVISVSEGQVVVPQPVNNSQQATKAGIPQPQPTVNTNSQKSIP